jgi:starch synthase
LDVGGRLQNCCEVYIPLKIAFLSHEAAPYAKVGGLADVAGSLPKSLRAMGEDIRLFMPAYKMVVENSAYQFKKVLENVEVAINPVWSKTAEVWEGRLGDVPVILIGTDEWFTETVSSETVYQPGCDQHLFFSRAFFSVCKALGWVPDIVHANDWHTGMVPVMLRESSGPVWERTASIFTIHNLAYQGDFGEETLAKAGLRESLFNMFELEFYGKVNFLKAGCVFADKVNTVSPQYAQEIKTEAFGCKLEGLMQHLDKQGKLSGILNGLDADTFNPQTDPYIAAQFGPEDQAGKAACKEALLRELSLNPIPGAPLLSIVSRLSHQKGIDMVAAIVDRLALIPCQLVIQGIGDKWFSDKIRNLESRFPYHVRFVELFDPGLAQKIYAGSDIFLMPSAFEPCGLGQLIAMRYGTIPVVHKVGGLSDTVTEGVNGFVYTNHDSESLLATIRRAVFAYGHETHWAAMRKVAMKYDSSWGTSAAKYLKTYQDALESRTAWVPLAS